MGKKVINSILLTTSTLIIASCSGNSPTPSCAKDAYCYKNINFGKSRGSSYEHGIRDGCRTGEGEFTKDYSSSSSDKNYYDGWILGRSKCKQILPNEGTKLEEEKSRQRAEYQIRQMKLEQGSKPSEESIVDALMGGGNDTESVQETEY